MKYNLRYRWHFAIEQCCYGVHCVFARWAIYHHDRKNKAIMADTIRRRVTSVVSR